MPQYNRARYGMHSTSAYKQTHESNATPVLNAILTPRQREEGQKTLKAKEEMEAAKQRRDIDAMAREKREAKEKQVSSCVIGIHVSPLIHHDQAPFTQLHVQERILREIEEDKMKRKMEREAQAAAKSGTEAVAAAAAAPPPSSSSSASDPNGKCLIRIRRLDGGQVTEEFLNGDTLKHVYDRIVQKSHAPMGMFEIATPMPRRVYWPPPLAISTDSLC
jgi:hypothetical protein